MVTEAEARAKCAAEGLDPDEMVFVQRHDIPGEVVYQEGTGFIRGVRIPRWRALQL